MRLDVLPDLDVGDTTDRYQAYAPEPIEPEITEVLQRIDPRLGTNNEADHGEPDDDEPPPLPPVPAGRPQSYPIARVAIIKRVLAPRPPALAPRPPVPPRRPQRLTPDDGVAIYQAVVRALR
jgi:hypothetical protein